LLIFQVNCTPRIYEERLRTYDLNISVNNNNTFLDDLCQSIDNDYIAHPTDCKRYAYCANGKTIHDIE
jgi:hypothetical protein